ncbi:PucR family transcriptional regulator [Streptomyces oceani]|uniref:PucR C-terminal helix-turn-helix domain-containing protein n=1 Tax=Streptomyces oceani TaxID=1075402 RepID=A0A1E7KNQ1_9ACTN|nr:helix-turn-helix domain-containing protein [Streptomyces oceani]OEV05516.1 hypothetical protein AN216_02910 [Streptomyces oceani]
MREDYQSLIDEISALLGTPATLEGRDFALIAFGAHEAGDGSSPDLDPVRTSTILRRRSSTAVRAWFESYGIAHATGPVHIPPDPTAGVSTGRLCLPARHGGVVHGYVWLLEDAALETSDPRLLQAQSRAARIGELLAADARAGSETGELLSTLLEAPAAEQRARAEEGLAAKLRDRATGPLAMLAVVPWPSGQRYGAPAPRAPGLPNVLAESLLPVRQQAGRVESGQRSGRASPQGGQPPPVALAALVRLHAGGSLAPARTAAERLLATPRLSDDGTGGTDRSPGTVRGTGAVATVTAPGDTRTGAGAGLSAPTRGLGELRTAWRQALAAARVAAADPRHGPVGAWESLGPYRLLVALGGPHVGRGAANEVTATTGAAPAGSVEQDAADPAVRPLLAHRGLSDTVECFLDRAGQAGRTASELGIHRQTLYYRLSRAERLTGLDLHDGEHRLLLHMALKAARLAGRP